MIIKHIFNKKEIKKESPDPGFLITNRNGSYYSSALNNSRYEGFFIHEKEQMYKIIDEIMINKPIKGIINNFSSIALERENLTQQIYMFKNLNSAICLFDKHAVIEFLFDVKKSFDNRNFGRYYKIYEEKNKIIVQFEKKTSNLENEQEGNLEYSMHIVINLATYSLPNQWVKRSYSYDRERNSMPYERYVYHGLKVISNKLIVSASQDKHRAIRENDYILKNLDRLIKSHSMHIKNLLKKFNHKNKEIDFALKCSVNSLDQLSTENGIVAGLPWFFQHWARDELLCTKALRLFNKNLAIQILNKYTNSLVKHGSIFSNKESGLIAKDAIGLLVLRSEELKEGNYKLILFLNSPNKHPIPLHNNALETWMDTSVASSNREGYRIEIQALQLRILKIMYTLTKERYLKDLEEQLIKYTKENFYTGKILKDGINDFSIRPNIFLAYYFCNEFLSKKEWCKVFDNSLPNIWDEWGGFSSIEKTSPLFQHSYTGENNLSYHHGDSWFFLNNLAALCMYRLNKSKYKKYIKKILEASMQDILWQGYIGFHSELSSSSELKAQGCKAQSWSSALFIELVRELKK